MVVDRCDCDCGPQSHACLSPGNSFIFNPPPFLCESALKKYCETERFIGDEPGQQWSRAEEVDPMLCHLCEPFLSDLYNQEFANWRHVERGWYTYKHGNHAAVKAAAGSGCDLCALFDHVRTSKISGYESLGEKWLAQASSIDYKYTYDTAQARANNAKAPLETRNKWTFVLLTVLPEMSWIAFELFDPILPSEHIHSDLPFDVPSSAGSEDSVAVGTKWLKECVRSHSHCVRATRAVLPTRLLHIDIDRSADTYKLRLQVNRGQMGQYVTLSHCWGSKGRLKLIKENLKDFQQGVPFEELPLTFQDAIRLTASMGQRYLWIDALCIVQNDQEDWRKEAASMCAVFENATFSISALAAEDSHSGLLQQRGGMQTIVNVAGRALGVRIRLPSLSEALAQSKLETRAWCLQERLLAPRILHVAPEQIHWECRTAILSETCPSELLPNDSGEATRTFTATSRDPVALAKRDDDHHSHWLALVAGYSVRDLTKASDRLPAISGLAEKARKELQLGSYAHGLWLDRLPAGLMWQRVLIKGWTTASDVESIPGGPSWSWASSMGGVKYPHLNDMLQQQARKADLVIKKRHPDGTRAIAKTPLSLCMHGRIKRGTCKRAASTKAPNEAIFRASGSLLVDNGLPCSMDEVEEHMSRGCYCLFVATFGRPARSKGKSSQEQLSCYLVLERVETESSKSAPSKQIFGHFRRIGIGFGPPAQVDKVFANAEWQRIELI